MTSTELKNNDLSGSYVSPSLVLDYYDKPILAFDSPYYVIDCGYTPLDGLDGVYSTVSIPAFAAYPYCCLFVQPVYNDDSYTGSFYGISGFTAGDYFTTGTTYDPLPSGYGCAPFPHTEGSPGVEQGFNLIASSDINNIQGAYWAVMASKYILPKYAVNSFNETYIVSQGFGLTLLSGTTEITVLSGNTINTPPSIVGLSMFLSASQGNSVNLVGELSISSSGDTWTVTANILMSGSGQINYVLFAPKSLGIEPLPGAFISFCGDFSNCGPPPTGAVNYSFDTWFPTIGVNPNNSAPFVTPTVISGLSTDYSGGYIGSPFSSTIVDDNLAQSKLPNGDWTFISVVSIPGVSINGCNISQYYADGDEIVGARSGCFCFITSQN